MVCWHTPLISALGKQRQVDLCEFEASLVCIANSRTAMATQRNPVSSQLWFWRLRLNSCLFYENSLSVCSCDLCEFWCIFSRQVLMCPRLASSYYVAEDGFEFLIFLASFPKYWDFSHESPWGIKTKCLCMLENHCTPWAISPALQKAYWKRKPRAREQAEQVRAPHNLSWPHGTHTVKSENWLLQVTLWYPCTNLCILSLVTHRHAVIN